MHGPGQTAASPLIWTGTGGNQRATVPWRLYDDFVGPLALPWTFFVGGPALVIQNSPKGILKMNSDQVVGCRVDTVANNFYRAGNPIFEAYVMTDSLAMNKKIAFLDYAGVHWGWGVSFDPALSANWAICNWNGAALIETPSTTAVVPNTWYTIRCWLTGAVGAQTVNMTINGADLTTYNAVQPDVGPLCFALYTAGNGAGGTGLYVDWVGIEQSFGATPA
jgi:hypothetical protein